MNHNRAFTVIEMLVVVSCIVILMGLLMPGVNYALKQADKTKAQTDINTLALSLRQYYNDYNDWPTNFAAATPTAQELQAVYLILSGSNLNARNPRRIIYVNPKPQDLKGINPALTAANLYDVNAASAITNWVDPWNHSYMMNFDFTFSDHTLVPNNTNASTLAVWSGGPDEQVGTTPATEYLNKDNPKTW